MITQKDVHNGIVKNGNAYQKAYLYLHCGNDVEKIKKVEQSMANIINVYAESIKGAGMEYLNKEV